MKQFRERSLIVILGLMASLTIFSGSALASGPVHWSYDGEAGPTHWGELSPDFALCATGTEQSPIDIPAEAALNPADLDYAYLPSAVNIVNNGHTIQVNYDAGSTLKLDNQEYELVQFHFHAASEHTNNGQHAPMEMHLVHRNANGDTAVVGVWLENGSENTAFAPVFDNLPAVEGEPTTISGQTVNADSLLPVERTYHRYNGSLTTPPCTQNVKWIMLSDSVTLSDAQIGKYTAIFSDNFRPTQPLNDRQFLVTAQIGPETLPVTGTNPMPGAVNLVGVGMLAVITGAGLYVYHHKSSQA